MTETGQATVVALGRVVHVDVASDSTVGDVLREAGVSEDLEVRFGGRRLDSAEADRTPIDAGQTVVATAPSVKHGFLL